MTLRAKLPSITLALGAVALDFVVRGVSPGNEHVELSAQGEQAASWAQFVAARAA